mmetsp:Transcript_12440/g.33035  ORF Transcript_12440/g.33035 Transcript_12440/m.33035 type:complete len:201 (+) Transcript_12440:1600-2202(+)
MNEALGMQACHGDDDRLGHVFDLLCRERVLRLAPLGEEILQTVLCQLSHHVEHAVRDVRTWLPVGGLGVVEQLHEYPLGLHLLEGWVPQCLVGRRRQRLHQLVEHVDLPPELLQRHVLELAAVLRLVLVDLDGDLRLAVHGSPPPADAGRALAHDVVFAHVHHVLAHDLLVAVRSPLHGPRLPCRAGLGGAILRPLVWPL